MRFPLPTLLMSTCGALPAQAPEPGALFAVDIEVARLDGCPERTPEGQRKLYRTRLMQTWNALQRDLEPALVNPPATPLRVALLDFSAAARERAAADCGLPLHGRGVIATDERAIVLGPTRRDCRDSELWRAVVHALTLVLVADLVPPRVQNELGYGWLAVGLAHRAEVAATGSADTFVVHDVVQPAVRVWDGNWQRAGHELARIGHLPPLADLLATEPSDFDFGQHVLALLLVELLQSSRTPTTHSPKPTTGPLAQLIRAAHVGTDASRALTEVSGLDLPSLEQRLQSFALEQVGKPAKVHARPVAHHAPHPHAAVFVYTRPPIRPRHREVVAQALRRRHAAHTSGWRIERGKPDLAVGPVNRRAGFWHADELVKTIPRTWPMVAVLEYDGDGEPVAHLDCLRRVRGRKTDDGWMLDPNLGFVPHHNAQIVTARDDRLHYLAIPDTPTGSHVAGSEFVHRGRVTWGDGRRAVVGVLTVFEAPKTRTTTTWHSYQTPLVDWRVTDSSRDYGARFFGALEDLDREVSPWGTARVLRFPTIPAGLTAGR